MRAAAFPATDHATTPFPLGGATEALAAPPEPRRGEEGRQRRPGARRARAQSRSPRVNQPLTVVLASWPDSRQRRRAMPWGGTLPRDPATSEFIPAPKQGAALQALLVLSCLIPVVVLALAGWRSWEYERAETAQRARTTLGLVEEHVRNALDTQVLVLDWLRDRLSGSEWHDIERSRSLYRLLAFLDQRYAQIDGIFLVDAAGGVRINSHEFPLRRTILLSDRDYFHALATGDAELSVSASYPGRWNGAVSFRVARPLRAPDGTFRGIVALAVHRDYFEKFFGRVVGASGTAVTLALEDGRTLASFPRSAPMDESETLRIPVATAENPIVIESSVSSADGWRGLTLVHAVAGYPVVLVYRVPEAAILAEWRKDFSLYGVVALFSACILSSMTYIAMYREQRGRAAVAAWQREQLQRLNAEADARRLGKYEALGTLAGGIAHHFNNLLPALTGHLEIAMAESGDASPALPRLGWLLQEVGGARKLIREILLYSRREITAFRSIDLGAVAAEAVQMFRARLPNTAKLTTDIAADVIVLGDPVQLSQLVTNLLANAYDALVEQTGDILLIVATAAAPQPNEGAVAAYARLVCRDSGVGMTAAVAERAFDPFFTTKPPGSGSGLGLAICDGIVRSHGGRISVDSAVGRGTSFTVLIPLARQEGQ
jgi:signal transduction histidine kinase